MNELATSLVGQNVARQVAEVLYGISQKRGCWLEKRFFEKAIRVDEDAQSPTLVIQLPVPIDGYVEEMLGAVMAEFTKPLLSQPEDVISFHMRVGRDQDSGKFRYAKVASLEAFDQHGINGFKIHMDDFNDAAKGDLRNSFYPSGNWERFDRSQAAVRGAA